MDWLDQGDKLASIGAFVLAAVGVLLTVVAMRAGRRAPGLGPAELTEAAAAELARLVRRQWTVEASVRGLNRPAPIRVRWVATGRPVVAAVAGAADAAGPPPHGDITEIAATWRALPHRQIVVIGPPGAGKTTAMVLLICQLLADWQPSDPVPVLLPISTWHPQAQSLDAWLAARLTEAYPSLAAGGGYGPRPATELVDRDRIVPILDGLDELPPALREAALTALDQAVGRGRPLALTCRAEEYQEIVEATGVPLDRAAVVEIEPVSGAEAAEYLEIGGTETTRRRWAPVLGELREHPDGPLARALSTPLMVYLARAAYRSPATDPAELTRFTGEDEVEHHLLARYLPSIYPAGGEPLARAGRWLGFLAGHLDRAGTRSLAWWRLCRALPRYRMLCGLTIGVVIALLFGPIYGLVYGPAVQAGRPFDPIAASVAGPLFGLVVGVAVARRLGRPDEPARRGRAWPVLVGVGAGLAVTLVSVPVIGIPGGPIFGLAAGLMFASRARHPTTRSASPQRLYAQPRRILAGMLAGIAVGVVVEIVGVVGLDLAVAPAVLSGLVFGLVFGLLAGLVVGLGGPATRTDLLDPLRTLRRDRAVLLVYAAVFGAAFGLIAALLQGIRVADPWLVGLFGLVFGLGLGLMQGFGVAWATFLVTRCWYAPRGRLPWRTLRFLADAHQRGVLRQVGAEYEFRHARLQDWLARG